MKKELFARMVVFLLIAVNICACGGERAQKELSMPDRIVWQCGENKTEYNSGDDYFRKAYAAARESWANSLDEQALIPTAGVVYTTEADGESAALTFIYENGDEWWPEETYYTFFANGNCAVTKDGNYYGSARTAVVQCTDEFVKLILKGEEK